ncbi:MAG: bifunctional UDP-N-acetylglucosamine diphosphorylase/glucosamine-1-phosphate N-acetyltransferase GlmU, partial [Pseudomonadales bacterium]
MMKLHVVVLAAGKGSRMKSKMPKVLHPVGGKPMLKRVVDTAISLGAEGIHLVIGHGADQVRETMASEPVNFVEQLEQLGTGHAVDQALPNIPDDASVLVLYGDVPLISAETLNELVELQDAQTLSLLTAIMDDPTGYGRIVRNVADEVVAIVEQKDASDEQLHINEINTGILAVPAIKLKQWLPKLSSDNAQGEYYLTDIIAMAVADDMEVEACHPQSLEEVQGVNNRLQLCELECFYQSQIAEQLMLSGVTLYDPNRIDVRGDLRVGSDIVIDVNCVFEGDVEIADDVVIGPNCYFRNVKIGRGTVIEANTVIEDSSVGSNANIGPFARLRPGSELGDKTKVGNFVETKKAKVATGSKINHLSYVGDAELGERVNVGAGTITCNYDGANKSLTELGDDVFVGSNTSLVAPVKVDNGATIGAGSVI